MHRLLLVLATVFLTTPSIAQDLMPPQIARQLGLTQVWLRPINAPSGAQSVGDLRLYVHQVDPLEYIEIVQVVDKEAKADKSSTAKARVFGRIEIGSVGKDTPEAGRAEAMRLAGNETRRLKRRGINAELQTRKVPRVNLYSVASNGMLESRDAETGVIHWTVQLGDRRLPFQAIGVDDEYLSVINGDKLIQVDVKTGEVMGSIQTRGTPTFGAINAGDFAMIPMIGGSVEGYPLRDQTRDPFLRTTSGSALAMPTKSPDSSLVAWATDRGYVFVAESSGEPSVLFRLKTDGIVSGRIASAPGNRFFFGSENGQVYGLRATRTGEVLWSQSFGEPFYNEPLVVGNQVLISSAYGNLVSFDAQTGLPNWNRPIPNVGKLIGAFGDRLYVTMLSGSLGVIDLATGERVGVFHEVHPDRLLVNKQTDRLYLVSRRGEIQCLRPEGADLPTFNLAADIGTEAPEESKEEKSQSKSPFDVGGDQPDDAGDDDPFGSDDGAGADPFGEDGGDFGGEDPFAE